MSLSEHIPADEDSDILSEYLTEPQLAAQLHVSTMTLKRWRALREAPPIVRLGRRILYRRDAVEKWLAGREVEAA